MIPRIVAVLFISDLLIGRQGKNFKATFILFMMDLLFSVRRANQVITKIFLNVLNSILCRVANMNTHLLPSTLQFFSE